VTQMTERDPSSATVPKNAENLKSFFIQTWGCQMNVADSERMQALLGKADYVPATAAESADVVILNTCHIRENARHKVVSRLGELRRLKKENPNLVLAVTGCVAQAESKKLSREVPFVDLILGPDQIEEVPELLKSLSERRERTHDASGFPLNPAPFIKASFNKSEYSIPLDRADPWTPNETSAVSRFVNIIKGCNNYCTFCVVPYTRGREKSRSLSEVIEEVKFLRDRGAREIVLLGQNVNSYGLDLPEAKGLPFADLLYSVSEVTGIDRIRFMTSNPHDFTPQLAQAFADLPKLTSSFHLPVQSGSDRILGRMNRQYCRAEYLERVAWIRKARPDVSFSSDIIVGFPGETEDEFEETLSLIERMRYSFVYAYKYSKRAGTPAARFTDLLPESVLDQRLQRLLALQDRITEELNRSEIGLERSVLVLYKDLKLENSWYGRTYQGRLARIHSSQNILGQIVTARIYDANKTALLGRLTADSVN
jgi:tRNA-2-methylthio-N6-dimethylallyladenosine synthase